MENDNNTPIRWKKVGGGHFMLNGRMIKPGETFTATPNQIPKAFRDVCIPIDKLPPPPEERPIVAVKTEYSVVTRGKSKLWYDVVDAKGKVINEKALTKESAEQLAKDLS